MEAQLDMVRYYNAIMAIMHENKKQIRNVYDIIKYCMEMVEKYNIPGEEKSDLVILILRKIIKEYDEGISRLNIPVIVINNMKLMFENEMIQSTINVICDASKGKLKLNDKMGCLCG